MKICLKSFAVRWLPVVAMVVLSMPVWADASANTSGGQLSELLSQQLYCDTKGLLEGNIGIMIGLIMVFLGIWAMVQGAKIMASVPLIFIGAILTALPSVAEAGFSGLSNLLISAGISKEEAKYETITCPVELTADHYRNYQAQSGVSYPGYGSHSIGCESSSCANNPGTVEELNGALGN